MMLETDKKRILLIEDDDDYAFLMMDILKDNGFLCDRAKDSLEGLKKAGKKVPGLILLDLILPGLSGLSFLSEIFSKPQFKDIPIVVLTALDDTELAAETRIRGAVAYLCKSCSSSELISTIRENMAA